MRFAKSSGTLLNNLSSNQIDFWNDFYEHVMTLPVKPEDFVWPEDPMFCLACVHTRPYYY